MPLAREGTLADRIAAGPLPLAEVVRILEGVAAALDAAHGRGRLHRDVKPGNVLLDTGGVVWLSDFGIARRRSPRPPASRAGSSARPASSLPRRSPGAGPAPPPTATRSRRWPSRR